MIKKTVATLMAAVMTFGGGVAMAAAEEVTAPALTLDFEDEATLGGALYGMATYATAGGGQSGEGYLSLPGTGDAFVFNFSPVDGDDANYTLSFYSKTSVGENLFVETTPYVDYMGTLVDWQTYRNDMDLPAISNGEGKSYLVTGLSTTDGGEWVENRLEFRVPEGCDKLQIHIGANFTVGTASWMSNGKPGVEDFYRAIDHITITKTEYNLVRNGDFESVQYKADGSAMMPYANWSTTGNTWKLNTENGDTKLTVGLEGKRGADGAGSCFNETVYLYPGKYMITYDVKSEKTQGRMWIGLSGTKADGTKETVLSKYLYTNVDLGDTNFEHTHYGYFEISEALAYTLTFNNTWLGGLYTFDNIKLVPFDEENGDLHFGTIARTEDVAASDYGTWVPTSTKLWFMTNPEKELQAGDTVTVFGKLPSDSAEGAQVVTAVYTVEDGKRCLKEMQVDAGVPGQGVKGTAVTIPETEAGETVLVKAMVLYPGGSMQPLGDDYILQ